MELDVHPQGTFNSNPLSIAACRATIKALAQPGIYGHMNKITHLITSGVTEIGKPKGIVLYCDPIQSVWWLQFGVSQAMMDYRDTFRIDKAKY